MCIYISLFQCCVSLAHLMLHFTVRCSIWKQLYFTILILIGWMGVVPSAIQHSGIKKNKYCCKTVNIWRSWFEDKQLVYKCFAWGCKQTNWTFSTWNGIVNVCVCVTEWQKLEHFSLNVWRWHPCQFVLQSAAAGNVLWPAKVFVSCTFS